jgi:hypothetical protein
MSSEGGVGQRGEGLLLSRSPSGAVRSPIIGSA